MKKLDVMFTVVAILFLAVSGWGACRSVYDQTIGSCRGSNRILCDPNSNCPNACNNYCHFTCLEPYTVGHFNKYYIGTDCWYTQSNSIDVCGYYSGTGTCGSMDYWIRGTSCHGYECDTQTEADSLSCLLQGNIWQDGTCKINHCTAADSTWLSTSIAACTGSNNFAIVNTDSTCEHVGTCCQNDSIPSGNTCKWRCDSVLTTCNNRTGELFGGVLPDTSVSGQDTTFSYQCYYNCSHSPNPDSTVYLVEGNIVLGGPSDSIPDGIKSQSTFNSVRTETGGVYVYDYLTPAASEYIDSIAAMKCVEHLWRCVINNKYVYWYDNQEVPAGCTNIVRVK